MFITARAGAIVTGFSSVGLSSPHFLLCLLLFLSLLVVDLVLSVEWPTRKIGLVQDVCLHKLILYCWNEVPEVRSDAKHIVSQVCVSVSVYVSVTPLLYSTLVK